MTSPTPSEPLILSGDCVEVLAGIPSGSIDAIVTDPPYGLSFMGKEWDGFGTNAEFGSWCEKWLVECLRVLKPGGHVLAFGGTRTWHRLACAAEDVGFEMRDSLAWLYGTGFPKSLNVGKAIDKASPATAEAEKWEGFGTALKPAFEPIVMGRKTFHGTVVANVLEHGTGALNVGACRIGTEIRVNPPGTAGPRVAMSDGWVGVPATQAAGRFPANAILDEHAAAIVDEQSGDAGGGFATRGGGGSVYGGGKGYAGTSTETGQEIGYGDSGGASRFFYNAKASKRERPVVDGVAHTTVKPLSVMRWLLRMVTPPGGTVLEPFAGSGTTVEAAMLEGFSCIAIEKDETYMPLIQARIDRQRETLGLL